MDQVIGDINRLLNASREIGRAAATAHNAMTNRIFVGGTDAQNNLIGGGDYSPGWALVRNRRGRQTGKIDLRFTGAMERNFVLQLASDGIWESRFISDHEAEKSDWNEERYQQPIFELSEDEKKLFTDEVEKIAKRILS